jgi:1-deoxy-D-xylulose-5-phosphate reductoisomerase
MYEKNIAVLGSTGSVGEQALDVADKFGMRVSAISANRNYKRTEEQARKFGVSRIAMADESAAAELKVRLADTDVKIYSGDDGICEMIAAEKRDVVLNSIIGEAGLMPTLAVVDSGSRLALANKESLVVAGEIVMERARQKNVDILPVDSEHSAIFQCLKSGKPKEVKRILLTASGGPFFGKKSDELKDIRVEQALAHPTWKMGAKITIDSATMMNKGLEIIEARWLFGTPGDKINVVVHPESIIHSMIEYADGSVIAQMGHPDMREAIQFAFSYPKRLPLDNKKLDFAALGSLSFFAPDQEKFPALKLAYESLAKGGNMACIMNAANEAAVAAFLQERIGFYDITDIVADCMAGAEFAAHPDLDAVFATNEASYALALEKIERVAGRKSF